ncbi:glycosyltransferase family 39 protein [Caldilinea sp.]|jgi:4-amino-4-deoxy-L-arabinose transferase-like glycosyltransferase|uniref:ArnT family glycosyltransferase n=1 Tax=Caldilinea sp. TaxID=2293560 RepID=UPI0021DB8AEA|nr:hypothetical protein [Caldilinea sp.]GIV73610.1 MAG: hypothetical protein KatS3mg049_2166 [Caldilinea sp.]
MAGFSEGRPMRPAQWPVWSGIALVLAACFALLLGLNMRRGLNHDEHQFVASAVLMARHGLIPYADFPYFHVPAQTLLNAALFTVFDRFLLTARLISVVSGWLSLVLVFWLGFVYAPFGGTWARFGYALAGMTTLMAAPMFVHTSGRAWNHDLPMLLTLLSLMAFLQAVQPARSSPPALSIRGIAWTVIAGVLLGLATATRLSYAFLAPAFALGLWLWGVEGGWRPRAQVLLWLVLGGLIGLAPVWWALWAAPEDFLFGNVVYNLRLNPLYYAARESTASMTPSAKLAYLGSILLEKPTNLILPLLFVATLLPALPRLRTRAAIPLKMTLLLLPFALFSAMSPTPSQIQYYYLLYPLFLLGVFFSAALGLGRRLWMGAMLGVAAIGSVLFVAVQYGEGLAIIPQPSLWYPEKVHQRSQVIARLTEGGRVLTLAPIYALEGGSTIYPELVTGPMAWRVAPLLSAAERARFGFIDAATLEVLLAQQPPRGVLTDFEEDDAELERVFVDYARTHDFTPVPLPGEGVLWLSGMADWNDAIRLGGVELPNRPLKPGETIVVTLYLLKRGAIDRDLNVLVRLVNAQGREGARSEGWPYGSPTSAWEEGVMWPDGHRLTIDPQAPPGIYRIEVSFYDPETLDSFGGVEGVGYLVVEDESAQPRPLAALATFAQGLDLLLADVGVEPWRRGEQTVTLYWRPSQRLDRRYTVFVHLLAPDGQLVAQRDQPPLQGFYPSDRWLPGVAFYDAYSLSIPKEAAPGLYRLSIGLYDSVTGQRLPLVDPKDSTDAFQALRVAIIE